MSKQRNPRVLCACCGRVTEGEMGTLGQYKPVEHRDEDNEGICAGYFRQNYHRVEVMDEEESET